MLLITIISSDDLSVTLYDTGDEVESVVHDMVPETAKHVSLLTETLLVLGRPMDIHNNCSNLQNLHVSAKEYGDHNCDWI